MDKKQKYLALSFGAKVLELIMTPFAWFIQLPFLIMNIPYFVPLPYITAYLPDWCDVDRKPQCDLIDAAKVQLKYMYKYGCDALWYALGLAGIGCGINYFRLVVTPGKVDGPFIYIEDEDVSLGLYGADYKMTDELEWRLHAAVREGGTEKAILKLFLWLYVVFGILNPLTHFLTTAYVAFTIYIAPVIKNWKLIRENVFCVEESLPEPVIFYREFGKKLKKYAHYMLVTDENTGYMAIKDMNSITKDSPTFKEVKRFKLVNKGELFGWRHHLKTVIPGIVALPMVLVAWGLRIFIDTYSPFTLILGLSMLAINLVSLFGIVRRRVLELRYVDGKLGTLSSIFAPVALGLLGTVIIVMTAVASADGNGIPIKMFVIAMLPYVLYYFISYVSSCVYEVYLLMEKVPEGTEFYAI